MTYSGMRTWNRLLVAKWRCLKTGLQVNPDHVDNIIRTVCLLHNIFIDKERLKETVTLAQVTPEDHSNVRSSRRHNRAKENACRVRDS